MPQLNIRGAAAALKAAGQAAIGDVVAPEEVARRANVCMRGGANGLPCPRRRIIRSPLSLTGIAKAVASLANRHRVPRELADYRCSACRCPMMLLVPAKEPHRDSPAEAALRPDYCWVPQAVRDFDAGPTPLPNEEPRSF